VTALGRERPFMREDNFRPPSSRPKSSRPALCGVEQWAPLILRDRGLRPRINKELFEDELETLNYNSTHSSAAREIPNRMRSCG
jgi:hypothetical protein